MKLTIEITESRLRTLLDREAKRILKREGGKGVLARWLKWRNPSWKIVPHPEPKPYNEGHVAIEYNDCKKEG